MILFNLGLSFTQKKYGTDSKNSKLNWLKIFFILILINYIIVINTKL